MARAAEIERRRGKVQADAHANRLINPVQSSDPDGGFIQVLLICDTHGLAFLFVGDRRLGSVSVVRFIV